MRILILGGAGVEGKAIGNFLAEQAEVSAVIISDRRGPAAEKAATEIGHKASIQVLDLNDSESLINLMDGVDIVVNCTGPFYRLGTTVLSAAIKARKNYVDIADDPEAVLAMFELDDAAKEAGITALIGMGSSPGLSNVTCKFGADKLDTVEKIHQYWCVHLGISGGGVGAGLHGWRMFAGECPVYLDGKLVYVPARSGSELVDFVEGKTTCYYLGHPEPVTLPKYIKGVKEVYNKGAMLPEWALQDQFRLMTLGFDSDEPVRIKGDTYIVPNEVGLTMHARYLRGKDLGRPWGGTKYEITGEKDGKKISYAYEFPKGSRLLYEGMEKLTAIPAGVGLLMLAKGQVNEYKGVVAPEGLLDPRQFLRRCEAHFGEKFVETMTVIGDRED